MANENSLLAQTLKDARACSLAQSILSCPAKRWWQAWQASTPPHLFLSPNLDHRRATRSILGQSQCINLLFEVILDFLAQSESLTRTIPVDR